MRMLWSPASTMLCIEQATRADGPGTPGRPSSHGSMSPAANRSTPEVANRRAMSACSSANTLTRNWGADVNAAWVLALRSRQTSTSGGSRDTELNELAVNPHGLPVASTVVTTVTGPGTRAIVVVRSVCWVEIMCGLLTGTV